MQVNKNWLRNAEADRLHSHDESGRIDHGASRLVPRRPAQAA